MAKVKPRRPVGFPAPGPQLTDKNTDMSEKYRSYEEWIQDYMDWAVNRAATPVLARLERILTKIEKEINAGHSGNS